MTLRDLKEELSVLEFPPLPWAEPSPLNLNRESATPPDRRHLQCQAFRPSGQAANTSKGNPACLTGAIQSCQTGQVTQVLCSIKIVS